MLAFDVRLSARTKDPTPLTLSTTMGFVQVSPADVNVSAPRFSAVYATDPVKVIAEAKVISPNIEQIVAFAHAGVLVTPVQLTAPMRGKSWVMVTLAALMEFASNIFVSCGSGILPEPAEPPEAVAHREELENDPVEVPAEGTQYWVTGVVNVHPVFPPQSPDLPETADMFPLPAPAFVISCRSMFVKVNVAAEIVRAVPRTVERR